MTNKRILLTLGGAGMLAALVLVLMWGAMVGATHEAAEKGTLEVSLGAVSPGPNISTADRRITIKLTDINLDNPVLVGRGPNGEKEQIGTADGEQLHVPFGQSIGSFILQLSANPIGPGGGSPIVDRNHDGKIDKNDIEIVNADLDGDAFNDLSVTGIFGDPERGNVQFQIQQAGLGGRAFFVRYATSAKELTRGPKVFTQTLDFPTNTVVTGERFTVALTNELATGDIFVTAGAVKTGGSTTSAGVTHATFEATGALASGDAFSADYIGDDLLTLLPDFVVPGGMFSMPLSLTLLDTNGNSAVSVADITVEPGFVGLSSYNAATNTATFVALAFVNRGYQFTLRYLGREVLTVPPTGLHIGEVFTLDLKREWLPLQDTNGDGRITTADITVAIVGVSATNTPLVTSIGTTDSLALGHEATGDVAGTTITLLHTGDDLAIGKRLKVTYKGLFDLVTVKGANMGDEIPVRLREAKPNSGMFQATIFAIQGPGDNAPNKNFDPTAPATADRPHIIVLDGGSIVVTYKDQLPSTHVETVRVQVEKEPPTFSNTAPDDKAVTNNLTTVLSTEVSDLIAGVNPSTELGRFGLPESIDLRLTVDAVPTAIKTADITVTETVAGSGVFKLGYNISKIARIKDAIDNASEITSEIHWEYFARDKAGNGTGSGVRLLKVINIGPVLVEAFAGDNWDPTQPKGARLRSALTGGEDDRTSIRVVFNQPMDPASFQPGDFQVEDVTVTDVLGPFAELPQSVFLIVDPPLLPDATPKVDIVGSVSDTAGNALSTGSTPAKDAMAPRLTVTLVSNYTSGDITFTVQTDEAIVQSLPPRTVTKCVSEKVCTGDPGVFTTFSKIVSATEWSFDLKGLNVGRYVIVVHVTDQSTEAVSKTFGKTDSTANGALVFEIDSAVPAPLDATGDLNTTPADGATIGFTNPLLLEIRWSTEATEYVGDSHGRVTLTKAELDGASLLNLSSTQDGVRWTIAIPDITIGGHTLRFRGTDEGGNVSAEQTLNFTVVSPTVVGQVILEGRDDHGGAVVTLTSAGGAFSVTTSPDGSYGVLATPGVYTVTLVKEGFLAARRENAVVEANKVLQLPLVRLLAGDTDGNGVVDIKDLTLPAKNLGKNASPWP